MSPMDTGAVAASSQMNLAEGSGTEAQSDPSITHSTQGMASKPIETWRMAAFTLPCLPLAAMLMPVTVYLPNYYATDLGVSLGAIGFAFATVRLFDLWLDPVLGFFIDKTNTSIGRYRPWLIFGLPIAVLAVWMLFMASAGIGASFILFWLIIGFTGQSMASMAHVAWAARIAPEYHQRARIFGWWQAFTVIGMLIVIALPPLLKFGFGLEHSQGVRAMGWFVVLTLPIAIIVALTAMPEPPCPVNEATPNWKDYLNLVRRPSVLRILIVDICLGTGPVIAGTLFFFYFEAIRGFDRSEGGLLLLLYFSGALAGAPIWAKLGQRMGKHRALVVGALVYTLAQGSVVFMPHGTAWAIITMAFAGLPFTAGPILLRAMMADIADEDRLLSGNDRNGLLFGLLSGSVKIGSALAVFFAANALEVAGFQPKLAAENGQQALNVLELTFAIVPAFLGFVGAMIIWGHKLDMGMHNEIRRKLQDRDALHAQQQRR